ncbi:MAG: DUF3263 domain-containing protein [Actinobacteria bacterium]|mgnify:CR=1 FL=1|nr:DUF3263 domain-containing protein [Actinomycetota bacterium]
MPTTTLPTDTRPTSAATTTHSSTGSLSQDDRAILEFERVWWRFGGAKEEAIREKFSLSATRYYQRLNTLIDRPEALESDPVLVRRLQRLRQSRQEARSAKRLS